MRLFIAVDVSDAVKQELERLQNHLSDYRLNFSKPENLHLTLKFLGDCDTNVKDCVIDSLKQVKFSPFELQLDKQGYFNNENYLRVLWIGIQPENKIIELQKQVDTSLSSLFQRETKFKSHLTLARVYFLRPEERKHLLETYNALEPNRVSFPVNSFVLYQSTLTAKGPIYDPLHTFSSQHI